MYTCLKPQLGRSPPQTCCQDVPCHPEGGQSTDHGPSPQARLELREVGEYDRDGTSHPGTTGKHLITNRAGIHTSDTSATYWSQGLPLCSGE